MLARIASVLAMAAVISLSCGGRFVTESPRPTKTATPQPTTLSLTQLMQSGRLRVAFNQPNITCVRATPVGVAGPCVEIARELAVQMRAQLVDILYDSRPRMLDAGRRGDWDLAFLGLDATAAPAGMTFTPPFVELEQTYLVPGNSTFRSVVDVDKPGVRIASFSPSPIEGFLKQNLKHATVVDASSIAHGARLIEDGQAQAYAASRAELVEGGWRLAGGRILDDSITTTQWGIAVASNRADLLGYVTQFLEYAKGAGVIQAIIETNKVAGARVAR